MKESRDARAKQCDLSAYTCMRVQPDMSSNMTRTPQECMDKHWLHLYAYECVWLQH